MSMQLTTTLDGTSESRPLTETEVDDVNGALLPLLVAGTWMAACFMWGMVAGDYLHEYYNS